MFIRTVIRSELANAEAILSITNKHQLYKIGRVPQRITSSGGCSSREILHSSGGGSRDFPIPYKAL